MYVAGSCGLRAPCEFVPPKAGCSRRQRGHLRSDQRQVHIEPRQHLRDADQAVEKEAEAGLPLRVGDWLRTAGEFFPAAGNDGQGLRQQGQPAGPSVSDPDFGATVTIILTRGRDRADRRDSQTREVPARWPANLLQEELTFTPHAKCPGLVKLGSGSRYSDIVCDPPPDFP